MAYDNLVKANTASVQNIGVLSTTAIDKLIQV